MTTTSVRIDAGARRRLEEISAARGDSLSRTLSDLVNAAWWEEACRQEREARRLDLANPEARDELAEWDALNDDDFC